MSTPTYLAWSLLASGVLAALIWVLVKTRLIATLYRRHLQRRLDRRLARGSDRYFEELRSIETAIERHDATAATSGLYLGNRFTRFASTAIFVACVLLLGLIVTGWLAPAVPGWSRHIATYGLPIAALQNIVRYFETPPDRRSELAGGSLLAGFILFIASILLIFHWPAGGAA